MKKPILTATVAACLLAVSFASCDENDSTSYMPSYEGFEITPTSPRAGDTLYIVARQEQKGRLIYHADYSWTVRYAYFDTEKGANDTLVYTKKQSVVYDNENDDPMLKYLIPVVGDGGSVQVTFRGDFRYSGIGASGFDGSSYGSRNVPGYILWKASSTADGYCEGTSRWIRVNPAEE